MMMRGFKGGLAVKVGDSECVEKVTSSPFGLMGTLTDEDPKPRNWYLSEILLSLL
jgi:hypothetical protein